MRRLTEDSRAVFGRLLGAATGVIALHQVAYLLAHPQAVARTAAADGHDYLGPTASALVPAAAALVLWAVVCRLSSTTPTRRRLPVATTTDYVVVFLLQEIGERMVAGQSPLAAFAEPAVWVGLALAPAFGLLSRVIVRSIDRVDAVGSHTLVLATPPTIEALVLAAPALPVRTLAPGVRRVRGPPTSLR